MKEYELSQKYQKIILKTLNKLIYTQQTCSYKDLATICKVSPPFAIRKIMVFLEKTIEKDIQKKRGIRASVIVSKMKPQNQRIPSNFFFKVCKENAIYNGSFDGKDAINFHKRLLTKLFS